MKSLLELSLITLLAAAAATIRAEPADTDAPAAEQAQSTASDAAQTSADGASSPEVFVPTEDISEDFAVSFPVDI